MSVAKFIGILMSSREQAHVYHLITPSFSEHKALQYYYENIIPLLDSYAESYMGSTRKRFRGSGIGPYVNKRINTDPKNIRAYFIRLANTVSKMKLPKTPFLENIRQSIEALIRQTVYMLSLR